jgi:recombinational DNA repair protein (RecF pathway)
MDIKEEQIYDKCVQCGASTKEPINKDINFRYNYIEGGGQLCESCAAELDNPSL